jgi:hypothetical protein
MSIDREEHDRGVADDGAESHLVLLERPFRPVSLGGLAHEVLNRGLECRRPRNHPLLKLAVQQDDLLLPPYEVCRHLGQFRCSLDESGSFAKQLDKDCTTTFAGWSSTIRMLIGCSSGID